MITVRNQGNTLLKPMPYAGLILLHPFLLSFFKDIGVLNDNETNISSKKYNLSFHSLFYLATGHSYRHNYDMVFIKWFLNIPDEFNILLHFELDDSVKNEADTLLCSVIEHWSSLKNISNVGLREMFLHRSAILTEKEDCFMLFWDSKSIDILKEQIPWNLNLFRVCWKPKTIRSDW